MGLRRCLVGLSLALLAAGVAGAGELIRAKWHAPDGTTVWVRVDVEGDELRLHAQRPIAPVGWAVLCLTPSNRVRWELYDECPPGAPRRAAREGEAWVWQDSEWRLLQVVVLPVRDAPRRTARR